MSSLYVVCCSLRIDESWKPPLSGLKALRRLQPSGNISHKYATSAATTIITSTSFARLAIPRAEWGGQKPHPVLYRLQRDNRFAAIIARPPIQTISPS